MKLKTYNKARNECPKCGAPARDFMLYGDGGSLCEVECPKCDHRWREPDLEDTVTCKFCHEQVPARTAHRHDGGYVGDECCWDERLRATE